MIETLYKKKIPDTTDWRDQFYELALGEQTVDGQPGYFVRETQCWWDATTQRTVRVQYTLSPRQGFIDIEEARSCFESRRMDRARRGFVHSYTPRFESAKKNKYVLIRIPAEREQEQKNEPTIQSSREKPNA